MKVFSLSERPVSFDSISEHVFSSLQSLTLSKLITDYNLKSKNFPFVVCGAFKDGLPYEVTELSRARFLSAEMAEIEKLQCSFRITNVQLVNPLVQDFTNICYLQFGLVCTVNLYVTPNSDAQCFVFHGDPHDSLIYQITGAKEWSFPVVDSSCAFLRPGLRADASLFNERKVSFEERKILMNKGDVMTFPMNMIHKAVNHSKAVSAHLTISTSYPNSNELNQHILSRILHIESASQFFHKEVNSEKLSTLVISPLMIQEWINSYYDNLAMKERAMLQQGREY